MTNEPSDTPKPEKPETFFWRWFPATVMAPIIAISIGVGLAVEKSKPKPFSVIQDEDTGTYGYVRWDRDPVFGFITCESAKMAADKEHAWSDEFDRKMKDNRGKPKPKSTKWRVVDLEKECR